MESGSLNTIQKLAKIARVITGIVLGFSIAGTIGCVLGFIILLATRDTTILIGGKSIWEYIIAETGQSLGTALVACAKGLFVCLSGTVLAVFDKRYLTRELEAGTPFTFEGADELKRLGILHLALPIVCEILYAVAAFAVQLGMQLEKSEMNASISLTGGVLLLVFSVVCRYGAELRLQAEAEPRAEDSFQL